MTDSKANIARTKSSAIRRLLVRQWQTQNKNNKTLGRPTIKLEEHKNDIVSEYLQQEKYDDLLKNYS